MSVLRDVAQIEHRVARIARDFAPADMSAATFAGFVHERSVSLAIVAGARAAGLDPALGAAVAQIESGGNANARSAAGAQGLMQLMPQTARSLGITDPYDPMQNVRAGALYLRTLLDRFGDLRSAIAAYNAGPHAVARYGGIPPYAETQTYVARVMATYRANLHR